MKNLQASAENISKKHRIATERLEAKEKKEAINIEKLFMAAIKKQFPELYSILKHDDFHLIVDKTHFDSLTGRKLCIFTKGGMTLLFALEGDLTYNIHKTPMIDLRNKPSDEAYIIQRMYENYKNNSTRSEYECDEEQPEGFENMSNEGFESNETGL